MFSPRRRLLCEQVSHHPPVSAFHGEGLDGTYTLSGEIELRTKFWGKSIELTFHGHTRLTLNAHGETYTWNRCRIMVNDVILGERRSSTAGTVQLGMCWH